MREMKKTIFLDIDGCVFKHRGNLSMQMYDPPELLPYVREKLNEWEAAGHRIILVTGRKESMRKITEEQLTRAYIFCDQLIMGLNRGERIIINDKKLEDDMTVARAIEVERNTGLKDVVL